MAVRLRAAMFSSLLLTLQVFIAFLMQGLAKDQYDCVCSNIRCFTKEQRKYLKEEIMKIMGRGDGKPEYLCLVESEAQNVLLEPNKYEEIAKDFEKLEGEGEGSNSYQNSDMITAFLKKTIESWRNNITKIKGKTRFGCEFAATTDKNRLLCLFTW